MRLYFIIWDLGRSRYWECRLKSRRWLSTFRRNPLPSSSGFPAKLYGSVTHKTTINLKIYLRPAYWAISIYLLGKWARWNRVACPSRTSMGFGRCCCISGFLLVCSFGVTIDVVSPRWCTWLKCRYEHREKCSNIFMAYLKPINSNIGLELCLAYDLWVGKTSVGRLILKGVLRNTLGLSKQKASENLEKLRSRAYKFCSFLLHLWYVTLSGKLYLKIILKCWLFRDLIGLLKWGVLQSQEHL
jgi:hypothetical protein